MESPARGSTAQNRLLKGWREIATFLGRDVSTAKRWTARRGMPVHRLPGDARSTVYADPAELEAWLKGGGRQAEPVAAAPPAAVLQPPASPEPTAPRPPARHGRLAAAAIALAMVLGAGLAVQLLRPPAAPTVAVARAADPEAEELYLQGVYLWEKRTPDGLREAEKVLLEAVRIDPGFAAGHAALANTYNLLREYSVMPSQQAYEAAAASGRRAVALDPGNADAQSALAFAEFYGLKDVEGGLKRFELARQLDPGSAKIHQWLGNALLHLGRFEAALASHDEARRLDPVSRSVQSSRGLALFHAGRVEEALDVLNALAEREPDFLSPHSYLAHIHLARGDYPAFLEELRIVGRLREDPSRIAVTEAGAAGLARGGFDGMVSAMLAEERRQYEAGHGLLYNVARFEALAGDLPATLHSLEGSLAAGEELVMALNLDPAFRLLRGNGAFRQFGEGFGLPIVQ